MGQTVRFGISLDEKLLHNFDRLIGQKSHMNSSEAIRVKGVTHGRLVLRSTGEDFR